MVSGGVGPFPYHRLPKVPREEVALRRDFARRALPFDGASALDALAELAGVALVPVGSALHVCDAGTLRDALLEPLAGIVLAPAGAAPGRVAVLELDPALASWLADRLLGGTGEAVNGNAPLRDVERGALAFAAARVGAQADLGWRVGGVITTEDAFAAALGDAGSAVWSVELLVDDAPSLGGAPRSVRLWLPTSLLDALAPSAPRPLPAGVDLEVCIDGGEASFEGSVIASLRPGDVVVPDAWWWAEGGARASIAGAATTRWWCRTDGAGLVVERLERGLDVGPREGRRMSDEAETRTEEPTPSLESVGDAPVTLSLELARFELGLEELAALRPGEVLASGVPLGGEVRLRAGRKVIATGELVDVDGEVGVRLIALG